MMGPGSKAKGLDLEAELRRTNRNLLGANLLLLAAAPLLALAKGFLAWFAAGLAGLALWNLWLWLSRRRDPAQHPVLRYLAGRAENARELLEAELSQEPARVGGLLLTPTWLIHRGPFSFTPRPLADLVWAHKVELATKALGVIPVKRDHSVRLVFSDGEKRDVELSAQECEQALGLLAQSAPWAFYGFSEVLESRWRNEAGGMVEEAARRRDER